MAGEVVDIPVLRTISPDDVRDGSIPFEPVENSVREQVSKIIDDVKADGEAGLLKYAWRFRELPEASTKYVLCRDELQSAFESLPQEQQGVLQRTAARIRVFAAAQRASVQAIEVDIEGGRAGQLVEPCKRAGCYAPGGNYPLPSSVLMTACTARAAGVDEVVVASPRPSAVTKAAAFVAGADCLLCVGGAHAIAAFAHGLVDGHGKSVFAPCDIIVGPGNKYVTAAKAIVNGICGIDMLAGPSEVLVVADGSADPDVIAADLLAQAEHDVEARPILVTPDASVIDAVNVALKRQLANLPTRDVAIPAVRNGFAVLASDMASAIDVTNRLAPEHLEIQTVDAEKVAKMCKSFGGLFVGAMAAEVLGDYGAGPNHVLPTSCTAKYTGGLSVHTFLRLRTWMRIDNKEEASDQIKDAIVLARLEGLEGHARAAEKRLPRNDSSDVNGVKRHRSY